VGHSTDARVSKRNWPAAKDGGGLASFINTVPETVVANRRNALPFSKGLMAQSLSASGLPLDQAYALARIIEQRLNGRRRSSVEVEELRAVAEEVLAEHAGERAVQRFHDWQRLDRLDRPLIVLLAGTAGVGKSTLATMLANRIGLTRVIPTDAIREVLRASFSHAVLPAVHYSSFEASAAVALNPGRNGDNDLAGFARQAEAVAAGVEAILERALRESVGLIVEGVHLVPGMLPSELKRRAILVEALIVVEGRRQHQAHFSQRGGQRPAERYLRSLPQIRKLQDFLVERARVHGVSVLENASLDLTLGEVMELVLETVRLSGGCEDRRSRVVLQGRS
jgi:2-phosphoglycerate kinase